MVDKDSAIVQFIQLGKRSRNFPILLLVPIENQITMKTTTTLLLTTSSVAGFAVLPQSNQGLSSTALNGLFDGVKEAFSAPALERSQIDSERETPIDRWMGWSVVSEQDGQQESGAKVGAGTLSSVPAGTL